MKDKARAFIDVQSYEGYCRREYPRYKINIPVFIFHNNEQHTAKVKNISYGGCLLVTDFLLNTQSSISIQFLIKNDAGDFTPTANLHSRIVHVHKKHERFLINASFKGALFEEHGIQQIIDENK